MGGKAVHDPLRTLQAATMLRPALVFEPGIAGMKLSYLATLVLALSVLGPAKASRAFPTPAVDEVCASASSQVETLSCFLELAAASSVEVRRAFNQVLQSTSAPDSDFKGDAPVLGERGSSARHLRGSQVAWLNYSDAQCSFEGGTSNGGSGEDILEAECHYRLNLRRLAELQSAKELLNR
ncbi:MAG: DUF1311 domain-containing protein [Caulobacterales bacterium]|nr:DUF1311 domain-containing protein [Caulobacterales bacterium]